MRPIDTDVARSVVCLSVCVGHTGELCFYFCRVMFSFAVLSQEIEWMNEWMNEWNENENARILSAFENRLRAGFV